MANTGVGDSGDARTGAYSEEDEQIVRESGALFAREGDVHLALVTERARQVRKLLDGLQGTLI